MSTHPGEQTSCSVYVPPEFGYFALHYPEQVQIRFNKTSGYYEILSILTIDGRTRYETWTNIGKNKPKGKRYYENC